MRKTLRLIVFCSLIALPRVAYAACPWQIWSITTTSEDERYIFVLRTPDPQRVEEDAKRTREGWARAGDTPEEVAEANKNLQAHLDEEARLLAKYPVSGLYLNDGSSKPLWTGEWCGAQFLVASDGVHLVMYNPIAQKTEDLAVAFYASGKELRSYRVQDLLSPDEPRGQTSHGFKWAKDLSLDGGARVLAAEKFDGGKLTFDITSGELIRIAASPTVEQSPSAGVSNASTPQRKSIVPIVSIITAGLLLGLICWLKFT